MFGRLNGIQISPILAGAALRGQKEATIKAISRTEVLFSKRRLVMGTVGFGLKLRIYSKPNEHNIIFRIK